jgi:hypothetical protein
MMGVERKRRLIGGSWRGNQSRWGRADPESAKATDSAQNDRQHGAAAKVRTAFLQANNAILKAKGECPAKSPRFFSGNDLLLI